MATQSQIDANRRNAQKSTGPTTPEGRAVVRYNALKHGLTSEVLIPMDEDRPEFDLLCDSFETEYQPVGPTEESLLENLVAAKWRLGRARKEDPVQAGAGVELHAKPGAVVTAGQPLLTLHTDTPERFDYALEALATGITVAAHRHFQAATPCCPLIETFHPDLFASTLRESLTGPEAVISGGLLPLPDGSGLGVAVDEAVVDRYRIPEGAS